MNTELDGPADDPREADLTHAANGTADATTGDEAAPLPFYDRAPFTYIFPLLIIALIWIAIGLVCSPTDFRF